MDFKELVNKRESCRSYNDKKVSRDDLIDIIEMARMAPSACNSQPWKLIVVYNEKAELVPKLLQEEDRQINRWSNEVTSFILVCETRATLMPGVKCDSQYYAQMDIGIITANLTLAATSKSISTCIIGCFHEKELKALFNIPNDVNIKLVIALGYANKDEIRNKVRKPFDEVASFNSWE